MFSVNILNGIWNAVAILFLNTDCLFAGVFQLYVCYILINGCVKCLQHCLCE